jgi:hypothetical protein
MNHSEKQINNNKIKRVGSVVRNKEGYEATIIEYNGTNDVLVKFNDEYGKECHNTWHNIHNGTFHNPFHSTVYNVGFIGNVTMYENGEQKKSYKVWTDMIRRCYNDCFTKNETYLNCYVDENWWNYENFEKWFDNNYYELGSEKICLDKDTLFKNNKCYSENTCVFVPNNVNVLFIKSNKTRGSLPLGVRKNGTTFQARLSKNNKSVVISSHSTIEDAFYAYKTTKESYIKQVANEYKSKYTNFPQKLYDAMYSYEVEITD